MLLPCTCYGCGNLAPLKAEVHHLPAPLLAGSAGSHVSASRACHEGSLGGGVRGAAEKYSLTGSLPNQRCCVHLVAAITMFNGKNVQLH